MQRLAMRPLMFTGAGICRVEEGVGAQPGTLGSLGVGPLACSLLGLILGAPGG